MATLDTTYARSFFPALDQGWTLFDNAGGSVLPRPVIDRTRAYMERYQVQLGASYALSAEASQLVQAGHDAMATLVGADPGEVVLAPSTTVNLIFLAMALRANWQEGDEVIVTNLDHEANIGPWRRLEASGIRVREWKLRPDGARLDLADLEALLNPKTKLVAMTHCSNVVGEIQDVAKIAQLVHAADAKLCVDGVAFAPHRRLDVKALDVDFYAMSIYKVYGPHMGVLYGRRELLEQAKGLNHFFIGESEVPYKLEPGNVNHELTAALPGVLDYFNALDSHHFGDAQGDAGRLDRVFDLIAAHEQTLSQTLLEFLNAHPKVRVIGPTTADRAVRVPTISFVVDGRKSSEIPPLLDEHRIAVRWGDFYARRAAEALDLTSVNGVVRVSMVHYNTEEEVQRLVTRLDALL